MTTRRLLLAAMLAALPATTALAGLPTDPLAGHAPRAAGEGWELAQQRDVDVFYDRQGRRVLLDRYTGEVIAVERPRRGEYRRELRTVVRPDVGGPALGDRAAIERYERYREYRLGLREPPEQRVYPQPDYERFPDAPPRYEPHDYDTDDGYDDYDAPVVRRPLPSPRDNVVRAPQRDLALGEPVSPDPRTAAPEYSDPASRPETQQPGSVVTLPPPISSPDNPSTGTVAPATPTEDPARMPAFDTALKGEGVAKLQVLLDRAGVSPGVIDGQMGSNVSKAMAAYREITGIMLDAKDEAAIDRALQESGGPAFTTYTITAEDAAGPFVASVPEDYGAKARMERLGYVSTAEMLAERFHMDEAYLRKLNPGVDFSRPGARISVTAPGTPKTGTVSRIVADKGRKQVRAYDAGGRLLAAYPATIGSTDTPSPTGAHRVERVAFDPEYTYNPKLNFKQGDNDKVLTIPPGPNGPVGTIWIALSKPTYGIHGTPEPSRIGKTNSHGCVRLTNWDAQELAKMVAPGVSVAFTE